MPIIIENSRLDAAARSRADMSSVCTRVYIVISLSTPGSFYEVFKLSDDHHVKYLSDISVIIKSTIKAITK